MRKTIQLFAVFLLIALFILCFMEQAKAISILKGKYHFRTQSLLTGKVTYFKAIQRSYGRMRIRWAKGTWKSATLMNGSNRTICIHAYPTHKGQEWLGCGKIDVELNIFEGTYKVYASPTSLIVLDSGIFTFRRIK